MCKKKELIKQIEVFKEKYQKLEKSVQGKANEWLSLELTYNSNAIEGSTVTRQEAESIVNKNMSVAGKTIDEVLETKNHNEAIEFIQGSKKEDLLNVIMTVHATILRGLDDANAGKYRNCQVRILASQYIPPRHEKIYDLMQEMVNDHENCNCDILTSAIKLHYDIVTIHPFIDGNGRTARLMLNYVLQSEDYPLVYVSNADRVKYIEVLESAQTGGSYQDYEEFMLGQILQSIKEVV